MRITNSTLCCLLLCFSSFWHFAHATTDKYRLILRDDPSTSIVVAWNQVSGNAPVVYYDTIDHGTNHLLYAFSHGVDRTSSVKGMDSRYARLTGLSPNKVYYFVIKDDNATSARYSFKTIPNVPTERLSIIAGGDSRNNQVPRQNANMLVARLRAHAVMFGGDMTEFDTNAEWQTWFDDWQLTIAADGRMTPIIPARGNHEYSSSVIYDLFDVSSADAYYANTFGGNLFRAYTLNSQIATGGAQTTWLQNDLQTNNAVIWKAAQYHTPIRPHVASKSERNDIYSDWLPHFEQYGINFVVECDAHTVKSTYPIHSSTASSNVEGFERDDLNGIVYVGEGCWGAPLRANDDAKSWTRSSGVFNQFKLIYIDINRIEIRTVMTDNAATVGALNDANMFSLPSNIAIWNPAQGDVIVIENYHQTGRPNISLVNPLNGQSFTDYTPIPLIALSTDTDGGTVDSVQFFVNGVYVGTATSTSAAFRFDWTPTSNGIFSVYAKAFDNDMKMARTSTVWITVYGTSTTVEATVFQSSDDAEEYTNGTVETASTTLDMADDVSGGNLGQLIGIRFFNLGIPQGATIHRAYIQFESMAANAAASNLTIKVQDDANPTTFGGNLNISNRTTYLTAVGWSPPAWANGEQGINQQTSDLSALVQWVVNKPTWAVGNPIAFIISGSGQRVAGSFNAGKTPRLVVEYSVGTNIFPGNLQVQVSSSDDDAEEAAFGGIVTTTSSDLDIVYELGNQKIGIRFQNITIPKGAIIESAFIQFYAVDANSGSTNFTIKIQDNVNPPAFQDLSSNNISNRPTLASTVSWSPPNWNLIGESDSKQRTPNLAALLQGIVNKAAWEKGNAMAFIITGTGERDAAAYDGNPAQAPILVVNYHLNIPPLTGTNLPDLLLCGSTPTIVDAGTGYSAYFWNEDISTGQASTFSVATGGTYTLRVMDAFGQVAHDTFEVTAGAAAIPDLGVDVSYAGNPVVLSPTGGPFSSYLWNTGETTASITVNAVGGYSVTVTNSDGCSGFDGVLVYAPNALANAADGRVTVFPNPSVDYIHIKMTAQPSMDIDFQLVDAMGRTVLHKILPQGQQQWVVATEGIAQGLYWLVLTENGTTNYRQAIVIQY